MKCIHACMIVFSHIELGSRIKIVNDHGHPFGVALDWLTSVVIPCILDSNNDAINAKTILSMQLTNAVLSVISDCIVCEYPLNYFSGYLVNWAHSIYASPSMGQMLSPSLARVCYSITLSLKNSSDDKSVHTLTTVLRSILSIKYNEDTDTTALMKNVNFILTAPFSDTTSSSIGEIYRVVLKTATDSIDMMDSNHDESKDNFFVSMLCKSTPVFSRSISILCNLILGSLQGRANSTDAEKLAYFTSMLLRSKSASSKLGAAQTSVVQSTLSTVITIQVSDADKLVGLNVNGMIEDKENSGLLNVADVASGGDGLQRRIVDLLRHGITCSTY